MNYFNLPIVLCLTIISTFWTLSLAAQNVIISDSWVRYAPPSVKTHAGYLSMHNTGNTSRVLTAAESPLYERVELHLSKMENGIATMQKVEQIKIQAGKMIMFKPGGLHMMLIGPKNQQTLGAVIPITLSFQNGEKIDIKAVVKKTPNGGTMHDHDKMKMN